MASSGGPFLSFVPGSTKGLGESIKNSSTNIKIKNKSYPPLRNCPNKMNPFLSEVFENRSGPYGMKVKS